MSGEHHQRTGWTYGPRPRGLCTVCRRSKVIDTHGLVVAHRSPDKPVYICDGGRKPPDPEAVVMQLDNQEVIVTEPRWCVVKHFPPWANRWLTCGSMLKPDGKCGRYDHDQPEENAVPETKPPMPVVELAASIEAFLAAFALFRARMQDAIDAGEKVCALVKDTDMAGAAQADRLLMTCDACDATAEVTATDDGRALVCATCAPLVAHSMAHDCPDCGHGWTYHTTGGPPSDCCAPVDPATGIDQRSPNDPSRRCACATKQPPADGPEAVVLLEPDSAATARPADSWHIEGCDKSCGGTCLSDAGGAYHIYLPPHSP